MSTIETMISDDPSVIDNLSSEQFIKFRKFIERQRELNPKEVKPREYPIEDVHQQYQCSLCHDIGFVRVAKAGGIGSTTEPCQGIGQRGCPIYQKNVFRSISKFSVPPIDLENMKADWTTFPSSVDKVALGKMKRYAKRLAERDLKDDLRGALLYGKNQIGKTGMAYCVHQEVLKVGLASVFIDSISFFNRLHTAMFEKDNPDRDKWLMEQFCNVYHLVLDDLGAEKMTETREEQLFTLLNRRTKSNLATTITSNLDGSALEACIKTRCYARIAGRTIRQIGVQGDFCELTK